MSTPPPKDPAAGGAPAMPGVDLEACPSTAPWLVACLCAEWCGTCRDYRATFAQVAQAHPEMRFVWIDIEDHGDALAPFDLDIENFPSVLVARDGQLRFLGALLPHAVTLARTIEAAQQAVLVDHPLTDAAALVGLLSDLGVAVR